MNTYHEYLIQTETLKPNSRILNWTQTDRDEMYVFLCIAMAMNHVRKHRMKDYWEKDALFCTPAFGKLMTYDRFLLLLKHLHFYDKRTERPDDKFQKIKLIFDDMREKFTSKFKPFQDLCIDESLVLWRGRLAFRQYMPQKRHRFGFKIFEICDVDSGYILDFMLYTGAATDIQFDPDLKFSGSVVKTLMTPYLGKGHNLFVDSWYTSPKLFEFLHENNTGACGTVRPNRKHMPELPPIRRGEVVFSHKNNIMCIKWSDKRVVHVLTSIHTDKMVDTGKIDRVTKNSIMKPEAVLEYTNKVRLIDKADMMMATVNSLRKSTTWYKKLFFHILDMALLNSYYMFLVKTGKKPPFLDFSKSVIRQLLMKCSKPKHTSRPGRKPSAVSNPRRLIERHFPSPVPTSHTGTKARRRCHVCAHTVRHDRKRQTTRWMCSECDVGLCLPECFRVYHTRATF